MYYMKNIADSEHFTLLGATGFNVTGDPKEDFVPDIIQQARAVCSIEPQVASRALNLAGNIRVIEASAQRFISLFVSCVALTARARFVDVQ
jgi:hypothetical protein